MGIILSCQEGSVACFLQVFLGLSTASFQKKKTRVQILMCLFPKLDLLLRFFGRRLRPWLVTTLPAKTHRQAIERSEAMLYRNR